MTAKTSGTSSLPSVNRAVAVPSSGRQGRAHIWAVESGRAPREAAVLAVDVVGIAGSDRVRRAVDKQTIEAVAQRRRKTAHQAHVDLEGVRAVHVEYAGGDAGLERRVTSRRQETPVQQGEGGHVVVYEDVFRADVPVNDTVIRRGQGGDRGRQPR